MKKIYIAAIALAAASILLLDEAPHIELPKKDRALQFSWSPTDHMHTPFDEMLGRNDPLQVVWALYTELERSTDYKAIQVKAEKFITKYDLRKSPKLDYGYAHGQLPVGWWSGMDMFLAPLVLLKLSEHVSRSDYPTIARNLVKTALKSPRDGGSVWPDEGNGCWISEYSWRDMKLSDEYYVLNGHLFALTALKMIGNKLNDAAIDRAFLCAVKGTKATAAKFINPYWPLYMLNAPTINPPHYVLYEMMQFNDLHTLTTDPFFAEQASLRKQILAKHYPVYRVNTRTGSDIFFSASGPPHPYNLDLFETTLNCGAHKSTSELKRGFLRQAFAIIRAINPEECSVTARYGDQSVEIFKTKWFREVNEEDRALLIAAPGVPSLDAKQHNDNWITIDPAIKTSPEGESSYIDVEGRVDYTFPQRDLPDSSSIIFEIETDTTLKAGIRLFGGDKVVDRYLIPLPAGRKHLVALSKIGFDKSADMSSVDRIMIYVHTGHMSKPAHIRISKLAIAANQYELYQAMQQSDAAILQEQ